MRRSTSNLNAKIKVTISSNSYHQHMPLQRETEPELPKNSASRRSHKTKKRKPRSYILKYDDPDLKVVVRLLPPALKEMGFLTQTCEHSATAKSKLYSKFYYQNGSPSLKPFEEPTFSRAYFEFPSKALADQFKVEMTAVVYSEPETGDQIACKIMKPIFGTVGQAPVAEGHGDIANDPLFIKYMALRAAKSKDYDLLEIMNEMQWAAKMKRKQESLERIERLQRKREKEKQKTETKVIGAESVEEGKKEKKTKTQVGEQPEPTKKKPQKPVESGKVSAKIPKEDALKKKSKNTKKAQGEKTGSKAAGQKGLPQKSSKRKEESKSGKSKNGKSKVNLVPVNGDTPKEKKKPKPETVEKPKKLEKGKPNTGKPKSENSELTKTQPKKVERPSAT